MDFLEMQKEYNQKYGTVENDWEPYKKTAIVRFETDEKGTILGRANGKIVFRHNSSTEILPGETWIVNLVENTGMSKNYFAKPLMKLDSKFMFDLRSDQMDIIADYLWREQRAVLEPMFEERFKETIEKKISDATEESRRKSEERIAEMTSVIDSQNARSAEDATVISSLENKIEELNREIERMSDEIKGSKSSKPMIQAQSPDFIQDKVDFNAKSIDVTRIGPDSIRSPAFKKARYFVNLSADHRLLLVRPDNTANILCVDETIVLAGLSEISPFEGEGPLVAEYSKRYEGYVVYLK